MGDRSRSSRSSSIHNELKANLRYMRLCLETKQASKKKKKKVLIFLGTLRILTDPRESSQYVKSVSFYPVLSRPSPACPILLLLFSTLPPHLVTQKSLGGGEQTQAEKTIVIRTVWSHFCCSQKVDSAKGVTENRGGWPQGPEKFPGRGPEDEAGLARLEGGSRMGRNIQIPGWETAGTAVRKDKAQDSW